MIKDSLLKCNEKMLFAKSINCKIMETYITQWQKDNIVVRRSI